MATSSSSAVGNRKRSRPCSYNTPRESLEILYTRLDGKNWTRQENWCSTTVPISEWSGVTCNTNTDGAISITALELSQNNLKGNLEDVIDVLLPSLEQLWLSENQLRGNLPASLADRSRFPNLTILDVGSNQMSGRLHPVFTKANHHFTWFDITGNPLTSYFRYEQTHHPQQEDTTPAKAAATHSSPIPNVHVVESLLTPEDCQALIDIAIDYTNQNGGWQTDRHKEYQTTDIDVAVVGEALLEQCNRLLKDTFWPALSRLFGLPIQDLACEDLFLAKYSSDEGDGQISLPAHRDGSELSFVVTLNKEFQGGGTQFVHSKVTVAPDVPGTCVLFCGRLLHRGLKITKGTRYILAGFVRVYPTTKESEERLTAILESSAAADKKF